MEDTASGNIEQSTGGAISPARPIFVDDSSAAELDNFKPSPQLYKCACAYITEAAKKAFCTGDNNFLTGDGIAETLEFLIDPENAGIDKNYSEVFEDWKKEQAEKLSIYECFIMLNETAQANFRFTFWKSFNLAEHADSKTLAARRYHFYLNPYLLEEINVTKALIEQSKEDYEKLTDALIFGGIADRTKPTNKERVKVEWLNDTLDNYGVFEYLSKWLNIAVIPKYQEHLSEIKKDIAANYGNIQIFSFDGVRCYSADGIIQKLIYISRALKRETTGGKTTGGKTTGGKTTGGKTTDGGKHGTIYISQEVMAGLLGVSKSTVNNWENHTERQFPTLINGYEYNKVTRKNFKEALAFAKAYLDSNRKGILQILTDRNINKDTNLNSKIICWKKAQEWILKYKHEMLNAGFSRQFIYQFWKVR